MQRRCLLTKQRNVQIYINEVIYTSHSYKSTLHPHWNQVICIVKDSKAFKSHWCTEACTKWFKLEQCGVTLHVIFAILLNTDGAHNTPFPLSILTSLCRRDLSRRCRLLEGKLAHSLLLFLKLVRGRQRSGLWAMFQVLQYQTLLRFAVTLLLEKL